MLLACRKHWCSWSQFCWRGTLQDRYLSTCCHPLWQFCPMYWNWNPRARGDLSLCLKKKKKTICSIALPVPRVPAEFECALSSCLGCAFTLQVPSLVTARMWRLIFNAIYESLSTRAYASCTSELQVSGRIVWRCCENDCLDLSVYKRMEGWEKAISLVLGVRSWESEEGKSLRKWVLMVKHIF